jgi:hypothetical protein
MERLLRDKPLPDGSATYKPAILGMPRIIMGIIRLMKPGCFPLRRRHYCVAVRCKAAMLQSKKLLVSVRNCDNKQYWVLPARNGSLETGRKKQVATKDGCHAGPGCFG